MLKRILFLFLFSSIMLPAMAQLEPYKIYDKEGNISSFEEMAEKASNQELIFFGELHNNSLAHWLQLQLLKSLKENQNSVILAGEFFERDDQLNIDEWFAGKITDKNFEAEAKLWNNYSTDYKPLLLFAKKHNIPFVASNVPRKYASLVSRDGLEALDSLDVEAKKYLPPLPVQIDKDLPSYVAMKDMMHGSSMNIDYMIEAQALKDVTMAFSLFEFLGEGHTLLHINGSYHSNDYEGIVWFVKKAYPDLKIMTINTVEQEDINSIDEKTAKSADFIIVLPIDSPKSY